MQVVIVTNSVIMSTADLSSEMSWEEGSGGSSDLGPSTPELDASSEPCSQDDDERSEQEIEPTSQQGSEPSSGEESEVDRSIDSDLEDLYESFDYEDEVTSSRAPSSQESSSATYRPPPTVDASVFSTALYQGAGLTVFQSYLLVFQYAVRHSLTTKAFTELLMLLSVHAPQGAHVPKSVHKLKSFFVQAFPEAKCIPHPYCSYCQRPLASLDTKCTGNGCGGGPPLEFITIPLGPQIKRMMEGMCVCVSSEALLVPCNGRHHP